MLQKWCDENGVLLDRVPPFKIKGQAVSSSKIREFLLESKLGDAEAMLGHPFFYRGEIVHGDKRGRTIGFPTANMNCAEKFPLPIGVYATSVVWHGKEFPSVTNIGRRPTFTGQQNVNLIPVKIETHILDQTLDLYGEVLEVRFYQRLREEKKFDGIDALKTQIQSDVILARQVLSSRNF
jgi:riboflavin kinase/FMN adenylyltransferase